MINFVMATHGSFATGIKQSIKLIAGDFDNLIDLSCYTEESFNLKDEIDRLLEKNKENELIVVTDIFGGSVNNGFMERIATNKNLHVISGLNLPLMLELLGEYEEYNSAKELIENSLVNTNDAIHYCNKEINSDILDEDF